MRPLPFSIACAGLALGTACSAPSLRVTSGGDPWSVVEPVEGRDHDLALGRVRLRASVCAGIDLTPENKAIDETSLLAFLRAHGVQARTERARGDLVYVEIRPAGVAAPIRLRVAILADVDAAGVELHRALREHGSGFFGVHRGNVAVLATRGALADVVALVGATKLACWGVLTMAGDEEAYVVGGGYTEP